jgi:hypothetical protein
MSMRDCDSNFGRIGRIAYMFLARVSIWKKVFCFRFVNFMLVSFGI